MDEDPPVASGSSSSVPALVLTPSETSPTVLAQGLPADGLNGHRLYPYYAYPSEWYTQSSWSAGPAVYHTSHSTSSQLTQSQPSTPYQYAPYYPPLSSSFPPAASQYLTSYGHATAAAPKVVPVELAAPLPSPRELPRSWDLALKAFLTRIGLSQTLRGFNADMLVMNSSYEKTAVPSALEELRDNLSTLLENPDAQLDASAADEKKLKYISHEEGLDPQAPASVNKSISQLLARSRARNDASNRAEFLHITKRRCLPADDDESNNVSAARVDAKPIDRDVMMKFDIAKNEEGPLRRTIKKKEGSQGSQKPAGASFAPLSLSETNKWASDQYPELSERLKNLESHLAIRYVPASPASVLHRLQLLEDHIISLEREYPPWAALFFHQPRRGWPPPPRATPVIVPSHLVSDATHQESGQVYPQELSSPAGNTVATSSTDPKGKGRAKSSLHRAVLDKLEVQRAMVDLSGRSDD